MYGRLRLLPLLGLACALSACAPAKKPATPFEKAMEHQAHGEYTEYRRSLERELTVHPNNLDARYNLAVLLEDSGHPSDAQKLYAENLRRSRHLPSAINLALLLQHNGNTDQANRLLRKTADLFPHEATPWYLLAKEAADQKRSAEANDAFAKAIAADRHNGFAHLYYARFLARQKYLKEAEKQAHEAARLLPDCAPCWSSLADILTQNGNYPDAIIAYQRSLALRSDSTTRQGLIEALNAQGEHKRAQAMQKVLDRRLQQNQEQP